MATPWTGGKAMLDKAVYEAFERAGYLLEDGITRNLKGLRTKIVEILAPKIVTNKTERRENATLRFDLLELTFPQVLTPEEWGESPEPDLHAAVWKTIDQRFVWGEVKTTFNSSLQRMVGANLGNGYVLCRTKIGKEQLDACYITSSYDLIQEDFVRPDNARTASRMEIGAGNREMLIVRQPEHADRYLREYERTTRTMLDTTIERLQLTVESLKREEPEDVEHIEEGGEEE